MPRPMNPAEEAHKVQAEERRKARLKELQTRQCPVCQAMCEEIERKERNLKSKDRTPECKHCGEDGDGECHRMPKVEDLKDYPVKMLSAVTDFRRDPPRKGDSWLSEQHMMAHLVAYQEFASKQPNAINMEFIQPNENERALVCKGRYNASDRMAASSVAQPMSMAPMELQTTATAGPAVICGFGFFASTVSSIREKAKAASARTTGDDEYWKSCNLFRGCDGAFQVTEVVDKHAASCAAPVMDGFGNENGAEVAAPGGWGDTDTAPSGNAWNDTAPATDTWATPATTAPSGIWDDAPATAAPASGTDPWGDEGEDISLMSRRTSTATALSMASTAPTSVSGAEWDDGAPLSTSTAKAPADKDPWGDDEAMPSAAPAAAAPADDPWGETASSAVSAAAPAADDAWGVTSSSISSASVVASNDAWGAAPSGSGNDSWGPSSSGGGHGNRGRGGFRGRGARGDFRGRGRGEGGFRGNGRGRGGSNFGAPQSTWHGSSAGDVWGGQNSASAGGAWPTQAPSTAPVQTVGWATPAPGQSAAGWATPAPGQSAAGWATPAAATVPSQSIIDGWATPGPAPGLSLANTDGWQTPGPHVAANSGNDFQANGPAMHPSRMQMSHQPSQDVHMADIEAFEEPRRGRDRSGPQSSAANNFALTNARAWGSASQATSLDTSAINQLAKDLNESYVTSQGFQQQSLAGNTESTAQVDDPWAS